jgi:hypothetical protein
LTVQRGSWCVCVGGAVSRVTVGCASGVGVNRSTVLWVPGSTVERGLVGPLAYWVGVCIGPLAYWSIGHWSYARVGL